MCNQIVKRWELVVLDSFLDILTQSLYLQMRTYHHKIQVCYDSDIQYIYARQLKLHSHRSLY